MHLRTIRLRSWACHDDLRVDLLPELNLCVGPNGAGKSTLYQAIVAALTIKHSSVVEEIRAVRPWGSEGCGPSVSMEVVRQDGDWQLTKTYLHEPTCTLEARRDGAAAYKLEKRGPMAEAQLDAWLEGDGAAGRLILALWSAQDDPIRIFANLSGKAAKQIPATLLEQFAGAAPMAEAAGPFGHLKRAIRAEYESRLTPEQRKIKKGSPLDNARKASSTAEALLDDLRTRREVLTGKIAEFRARQVRHEADCEGRARLRALKAGRDRDAILHREAVEALDAAEKVAAALRAEFESARTSERRLRQATDALDAAEATALDAQRRSEAAKAIADGRRRAFERFEMIRRQSDGPLDELANLYAARGRMEDANERLQTKNAEADRLRAEVGRTALELGEARALLAKAREDCDRAREVEAEALRASRRAARLASEGDYRRADAAFRQSEAHELARERDHLRESLGLVRGWRDALDALDRDDDGGPVPTLADLDAIRAAERDLARLGADLAGDSLTLRLVAAGPLKAIVAVDGQAPSEVLLKSGGCHAGEGVASLNVVIEGVGRFEVGRTAASVSERLASRTRLRAELDAKLREWDATGLDILERRRVRDDERLRLRVRIEGRLAGRTAEGLESRLVELERMLEGLTIGTVGESQEGDDPAKLKAHRDAALLAWNAARARCEGDSDVEGDGTLPQEEASRLVNEARERLELATRTERVAESALIRVEEALKVAEIGEAEARALFEEESGGLDFDDAMGELRGRIEAARQPLASLGEELLYENRQAVQMKRVEIRNHVEAERKAFSIADPAAREAERRAFEAVADRDARRARLEEVREEAGPPHDLGLRELDVKERERRWLKASVEAEMLRTRLPIDPDADAEEFLANFDAAHRACDEGEVELGRLRAELEVEGAQGLDSQLARAEEARDRLSDECHRLGNDAAAWALLHHLLAEVEERQARGIAARIEQLASTVVSRLTGGNVQGVTLDPRTLGPAVAQVEGVANTADIARFSRGTREQVALTCRLQIGRLLGREGRHMLLLDDPLAHTDPRRHREALAELADLSKTLQVIVFTCHLDRYGPLIDEHQAKRIDIPGRN